MDYPISDWISSKTAQRLELCWENTKPGDESVVNAFINSGGSGNSSIDKFVKENLLDYSENRYVHSTFLLNAKSEPIGVVCNSMGMVKLDSNDWMALNMEPPPPAVPALFLHRLGVSVKHQRKGLGLLLILRIFDTLIHSSAYTAASLSALLVEKKNDAAKSLYEKMDFTKVNGHKSDSHELYVITHDSVEKILSSYRAGITS